MSAAWLRHWVPNTAVGIVLGLGGQSMLWKTLTSSEFSNRSLGVTALRVNWFFWIATAACLAAFVVLYSVKIVLHRDLVRAEFNHPVRAYFFNGPHIALLMLCLSYPADSNMRALRAFWALALAMQSALMCART